MLVTIKAAKGRHVFVGEGVLSDKFWSSHPISAAIVKQIKTGDIIEATAKDLESTKVVAEKSSGNLASKTDEDKSARK